MEAPVESVQSAVPAGAPHEEAWQRCDKWVAFYDGSFAPHLGAGVSGHEDQLPWRSFSPSSQLQAYLQAGRMSPGAHALELGCGHGENLMLLAQHAAYACGVDVVPAAVEACRGALAAAGLESRAEAVCADILKLEDAGLARRPGSAATWEEFDFVFDCQCFHCLRQVPGLTRERLAEIYGRLLRPGGRLLLLTGSMEEPTPRGPERLTRDEVLEAFTGHLELEELSPTHFDWTPTYRSQGFPDPPRGWLSMWVKKPDLHEAEGDAPSV